MKQAKTIRRIHITGAPGTGKTTLGKQLSQILRIPLYELDDLLWVKKYEQRRTKEERITLLKKITAKRSWITDSTSTSCAQDAVQKADLVIEIQQPRPVLAWRILRRKLQQQQQPGAPKETLRSILNLSRYAWVYRNPKKEYRQRHDLLMQETGGEHLIITNKKDMKRLLERVAKERR